jgi:hypothetical protein
MPAKPSWHAHLPKIRRELTALELPFVDRGAIQTLFGIRRRQANYLMRALGGYQIGRSAVVDRQELLLRLDEMAANRGIAQAESRRKASVLETLDKLRRQAARPRRIVPPPPLPRAAASSLPAGIAIASPGELAIRFSSPEELLGRILGLVQSASKDFAGFATSLASPLPGVAYVQPQETSRPAEPSQGHDGHLKEP